MAVDSLHRNDPAADISGKNIILKMVKQNLAMQIILRNMGI
jgi:hypothetical protein